ncbi:MAG: orotidine-5'-phosphate decarboxylase, partial [Actinobacteria bacterium]|nr:orotidine-5'-phosphate decarboxylase [Actinomycetota bacterium]
MPPSPFMYSSEGSASRAGSGSGSATAVRAGGASACRSRTISSNSSRETCRSGSSGATRLRRERLGAPGWAALEQATRAARDHGLLVIADGKRGDVPVTAQAYAHALVGETEGPFGTVAGLGVDAFTASPLLGRDALEPLVCAARACGAGLFALVRTSNPGAADVMDLAVEGGGRLWERLAALVTALGESGPGTAALADVGAVTGATAPEHLERMRELMPRTPFL